jgi:hypothetical protein
MNRIFDKNPYGKRGQILIDIELDTFFVPNFMKFITD